MLSIFSYFGVFNTIISWKMDDIMCLELSLTRPKSHSEKAKVEHVNITAIMSQVSLKVSTVGIRFFTVIIIICIVCHRKTILLRTMC